MKIPGDYFSGIPLRFCWCLGINSFWRSLGYLLELSGWNLGINPVWRQLGLTLGFAIPIDSFSGITLCFHPLGFTLLISLWGTTFPPLGVYYSSPFLGNNIKLCASLTAKLLTTAYESKVIKFKLDRDPLQHRIYFLTFVESLQMIFYHYKETCEVLPDYPKLGGENNKTFVKKSIRNLLHANIDVYSIILISEFPGYGVKRIARI